MDHGGMDHGGMDHGGMDDGQCSMNMLFNWQVKGLCIVFESWRVTGPMSLLLSLVAIALLTAGYECVREISRRYDEKFNARMNALGTSPPAESSSLLAGSESRDGAGRQGTITRAGLYALQVFYSFFIMLLFMTYNGFVMLAVAVGAFIGYLAFSYKTSPTKTAACH
ncbi:uncharacterized protein PV07_04466 [Cladophialophora immunda]|uniref:Copper transport protein n=2 Tax=Cladophialophora immunda TaxID=569365 RepID=A0A0D1ZXY7_9EURO|nr:uncharacterized protein PV07_04466 [Cladophialophora immunda]KIW32956.1 hypothetical protein PV07_04466 [Cladophialophora immunda]OQV09185.1 hypothetical protein CLAIMM_13339 isoform 2 [Cladophialophora immunda]